MAYASAGPAVSAPILGRVTAVFANFRQSQADYRLFKTTMNELHSLETRELTDLGIYRGDIRAVAHKSVYGN